MTKPATPARKLSFPAFMAVLLVPIAILAAAPSSSRAVEAVMAIAGPMMVFLVLGAIALAVSHSNRRTS